MQNSYIRYQLSKAILFPIRKVVIIFKQKDNNNNNSVDNNNNNSGYYGPSDIHTQP